MMTVSKEPLRTVMEQQHESSQTKVSIRFVHNCHKSSTCGTLKCCSTWKATVENVSSRLSFLRKNHNLLLRLFWSRSCRRILHLPLVWFVCCHAMIPSCLIIFYGDSKCEAVMTCRKLRRTTLKGPIINPNTVRATRYSSTVDQQVPVPGTGYFIHR